MHIADRPKLQKNSAVTKNAEMGSGADEKAETAAHTRHASDEQAMGAAQNQPPRAARVDWLFKRGPHCRITLEPGVLPAFGFAWLDTDTRRIEVVATRPLPFGLVGFGSNVGYGAVDTMRQTGLALSGVLSQDFACLHSGIIRTYLCCGRGKLLDSSAAGFAELTLSIL